MTESELSLVIGTYHRPASLSACLSSIERQTVAPREVVVVVDGGMTPEIAKVFDEFEKGRKLRLISVVNQEQLGSQASRNRGCEVASGDIVAILDDDVVLEPDWLVHILQAYRDNPDAAGVGGYWTEVPASLGYPLDKLFRRMRPLLGSHNGKFNFLGMPAPFEKLAKGYVPVEYLPGCCMTYRRDVLLSHKFDKTFHLADDLQLGVVLSRLEKRKIIYTSLAIAYHHCATSGGIGKRGVERLQLTIRDHTLLVLRYFDFKYARLALFFPLVCAYSLMTFRLQCIVSIWRGLQDYNKLKSA